MSLNYLKQNAFWVTKKNEEIIVIPKFLQNSSVSYFKAYEGEIYWEIRKFLGYEYMSDDNVSYKVKTNYVDAIRSKEKCLKVTFYLYVKNSPEFKKTRYRLPFYKSYQDGEDIGNLFINNSIHPNWIDVDSAEKVNSVIFKDFKSSFEKIKTDPNFYLTEEYEHYNGRIAETMAEVFFKRNGLFVQRHGVESLLGNSLSFIKKSEILEDENCLDTIKEYMSAPDLLIIKLNNKNELVNVYMMDVKWRKFANENELNQSLSDGGDLYYHSKKYDRYWERTYLFLIAIFQKDAKIYIIDNSKLDSKLIVPLDLDDNFSWLDKKEIEILNKEICKYWIK